jgi:hypothetical protein
LVNRSVLVALVGLILTATPPAPPTLAQAPAPHDNSARIVAIGDIHGDADAFVGLLRRLQLIDEKSAWSGGRTVLVQTGDFTDRGAKVRAAMDLLMALERQAPAAGGRVHVLMGNHEAMNLLGELRDVTDAIYASFADAKSEQRREQAYKQYVSLTQARAREIGSRAPKPQPKDAWLAAHPPGFIEYREALGPDGIYGKWLRSRDAVLKLGDTIFLHGGLSPDVASKSIEEINEQVRREIKTWDDGVQRMEQHRLIRPFFTVQEIVNAAQAELQRVAAILQQGDEEKLARLDRQLVVTLQTLLGVPKWSVLEPNGPLWFRGYATWTESEGAPLISQVLASLGASRVVVGHTILKGMRITPRFDGKVVLIDTGMLSSHFPNGRASALEIQDGRLTAIYMDSEVELSKAAGAATAR